MYPWTGEEDVCEAIGWVEPKGPLEMVGEVVAVSMKRWRMGVTKRCEWRGSRSVVHPRR